MLGLALTRDSLCFHLLFSFRVHAPSFRTPSSAMSPVSSLVLLALSTLLSSSSAYPNGAPACVINEQHIAGMGGQNTDLGFRIHPSSGEYAPGQPMQFHLSGPQGSYFKGILLYVSALNNPKIRVGNFNIPPGFHSNKDKCDQEGFQAGPNGVLTHSNPARRDPNAVFTWVPDGECVDVKVETVIAMEQRQWEILPPVILRCGQGGPSMPPGGFYSGGGSSAYGGGNMPEYANNNNDNSYGGGSMPEYANNNDNSYGGQEPFSNGRRPCRKPRRPRRRCHHPPGFHSLQYQQSPASFPVESDTQNNDMQPEMSPTSAYPSTPSSYMPPPPSFPVESDTQTQPFPEKQPCSSEQGQLPLSESNGPSSYGQGNLPSQTSAY